MSTNKNKKKKESKTALARVPHAEVSNNINMNLTQSDLIDMIIDDKLTQLRKTRSDIKEALKTKHRTISRMITDLYIEIFEKDREEYSAFIEFAIAFKRYQGEDVLQKPNFGDQSLKISAYGNNTHIMKNTEHEYFYEEISANRRTTPGTSSRSVQFDLPCSEFCVTAHAGKTHISSKSFKVPEDIKKDFIRRAEYVFGTAHGMLVQLYEVEKEMCRYMYQEKTLRAQLTRMTLNKTVEGKQILEQLKKVTGILS